MSAYPTLPTDVASRREAVSGLAVDVAEDGTSRARSLYAAVRYEFSLEHAPLTSAERDSLLSHYAANAAAPFAYTWPDGSLAHTVIYLEAPQIIYHPGPWYSAEVKLSGVVS